MKASLVLVLLFALLGCEKRVVDPEIDAVRVWLLSEEGQNAAVNYLAAVSREPVALREMVPCENWLIKRTVPPRGTFALYAEEKTGKKGRLLFVEFRLDGRFIFLPKGYLVTESEFEDFGDPVSLEKVCEFYQSWQEKLKAPVGKIVLVRRGNDIGAFILDAQTQGPYLDAQTQGPETMDYHWFVRNDGIGTFPSGDPMVKFGTEQTTTKIQFSEFSIKWSIHTLGSGWLYYSEGENKYEICVTDETEISKIDANSPKWIYHDGPKFFHNNYTNPLFFPGL